MFNNNKTNFGRERGCRLVNERGGYIRNLYDVEFKVKHIKRYGFNNTVNYDMIIVFKSNGDFVNYHNDVYKHGIDDIRLIALKSNGVIKYGQGGGFIVSKPRLRKAIISGKESDYLIKRGFAIPLDPYYKPHVPVPYFWEERAYGTK